MKKSFWQKILCVLLVLPIAFLASCKSKKGTQDGVGEADGEILSENYVGPGIHEASVVKTDRTFVAAGETEYKLIVPDDYYRYEYMGASLISEYIYASTGCRMEILTESEIPQDYDKVIAVGDTQRLRNAGISLDKSYLDVNGFRILSVGDTTYISGARTTLRLGTLYGAQEFLKHMINWRAYAVDDVWYDTVARLPYKEMNVVEVPDFADRLIGYYEVTRDETYMHELRLNIRNEHAIPFNAHSHFTILPPSKYANAHPDWYYCPETYYPYDGSTYNDSTASAFTRYGQLCISNLEMREEFIASLTQYFIDYPDADLVHLGVMDNANACPCDNCKAEMAKYNTNYAGISMIFANEVARRVQENIYELYPMRVLTFRQFAYNHVLAPPAHKENGVYVADAPEVIPADNILVYYCPLGYNGSETLDDRLNEQFYEYLEGWSALTDNLAAYIYAMNFTWHIYTHKNWDTVQANWRILSEHGARNANDQGALTHMTSQWTPLKLYCESNIMWNLSLNYDDLAYDFIKHYYGICADEIAEMWKLMTTYVEYIHANLNYTGNIYFRLNEAKYWSFSYVEAGRHIMERALAKLEAIKESDPAAYEKYYDRVTRVYMENMFQQMELYAVEYTAEYANTIIDLFERLTNKFNITTVNDSASSEMSKLSYYIAKWRSFYNG